MLESTIFFLLLCRWDGGTWGPVADWHLPQWEKWGDEQSAGCRQHGRCVLHAGSCNGPVPNHIHRRAPLLLATAILLYGCVLRQARHHLLHQQGEWKVYFWTFDLKQTNTNEDFTIILEPTAYWVCEALEIRSADRKYIILLIILVLFSSQNFFPISNFPICDESSDRSCFRTVTFIQMFYASLFDRITRCGHCTQSIAADDPELARSGVFSSLHYWRSLTYDIFIKRSK